MKAPRMKYRRNDDGTTSLLIFTSSRRWVEDMRGTYNECRERRLDIRSLYKTNMVN